jgi:hypothetical protein
MRKLFALLPLCCLICIASCKKDDDDPRNPPLDPNDSELITTCILTFTDTNSNASSNAVFRDSDGEGGNAPTRFDTIRLAQNSVYDMQIVLLDESSATVDTISNDVLNEGADHLFCFDVNNAQLNIARTDNDGQFEIGLQSLWTCAGSSNGHVTITLKHQPGEKDGTCSPGDTDVEINFPLVID